MWRGLEGFSGLVVKVCSFASRVLVEVVSGLCPLGSTMSSGQKWVDTGKAAVVGPGKLSAGGAIVVG